MSSSSSAPPTKLDGGSPSQLTRADEEHYRRLSISSGRARRRLNSTRNFRFVSIRLQVCLVRLLFWLHFLLRGRLLHLPAGPTKASQRGEALAGRVSLNRNYSFRFVTLRLALFACLFLGTLLVSGSTRSRPTRRPLRLPG